MTDKKPNAPTERRSQKDDAASKTAAKAANTNASDQAKSTAADERPSAASKTGKGRHGRSKPNQSRPTPGSTAAKTTGSATPANGGSTGKQANKPAKKGPVAILLIILIVVVLGLGVALFYQIKTTDQALADLQKQQNDVLEQAREAGGQATDQIDQAQSTLKSQDERLKALEGDLANAREEFDGLNDAFQILTDRGSDLVLLNDIDHLVTIAQQQLQLTGNVANAIMSLEAAQAQLARANRSSLASLQETINGDLDRLRAARTVDIALLSKRLDMLAGLVAQAPLLVPDTVESDTETDAGSQDDQASDESGSDENTDVGATASETSDKWWQKALDRTGSWVGNTLDLLRDDMGNLVSVRRVDDATALFVSPDQAARFRDHLRLRIMTAQLALMMGQDEVWDAETTALQQAIEGRFDEKDAQSRRAVRIAREMADTDIDVELPTVDNSMKALEALRDNDADTDSTDDAL